MAWRIVRQPNGKLARFADPVDDFTHMNMDILEAYELCRRYLGVTFSPLKRGSMEKAPW